MMPARFTPFPHLSRSRPRESGGHRSQISIDLEADTSLEILVVSWAILLRFYTEETSPTFKVLGNSVTIDTLDYAAPVVSSVATVEGERFTGIVDEDVRYPFSQGGSKTHGFRNLNWMDTIYYCVTGGTGLVRVSFPPRRSHQPSWYI